MLYGFIGRISPAEQLKEALDVGTVRTRLMADRVSKASMAGADGFALPAAGAAPSSDGAGAVDLESEMVSLADEQLRYDAASRLLEKAYQQIRTAIGSK